MPFLFSTTVSIEGSWVARGGNLGVHAGEADVEWSGMDEAASDVEKVKLEYVTHVTS